ncbi:MAG: hypothetical protein MJ212_03340 [Alphaproteobacteria bacterium]|nr:hypothetical protein [Alphaproteobacteria bacterium]
MRINESGRSMIEMLGVLAIIGVLSVGGIAGYTKAMNKYRINKVIDQVTMIVTNIRTLYAMQRNYDGLNEENAIAMGVIPDELGTTADDLETGNPYGGSVLIRASAQNANDADGNKAFEVAFNGLSKEACVALATGDWGSGHSAGLIAIGAYEEANTEAIDDATLTSSGAPCTGSDNVACAGNADEPVPMSVVKAASACDCPAGTNSCSVVWKYF